MTFEESVNGDVGGQSLRNGNSVFLMSVEEGILGRELDLWVKSDSAMLRQIQQEITERSRLGSTIDSAMRLL